MSNWYIDTEFNDDLVLCACLLNDEGDRHEFDTRYDASQLAAFVDQHRHDTFIAFAVQAEMESLLRLGIDLPENWIDLMPETYQITMTHPLFRIYERKNRFGRTEWYNPKAIGLVMAYALFTGEELDQSRKDRMRSLILSKSEWSEAEFADILTYC